MLWLLISKSRKKRPSNSVFMRRAGHSHLKTLVHRKLTQILHRESSDPRFEGITISRVETSPDLSFARVLVSHAAIWNSGNPSGIDEEQQIQLIDSLNRASGFSSKKLGKSLNSRNTPKLHFVYDSGFDHSDEIEQLIRQQQMDD